MEAGACECDWDGEPVEVYSVEDRTAYQALLAEAEAEVADAIRAEELRADGGRAAVMDLLQERAHALRMRAGTCVSRGEVR